MIYCIYCGTPSDDNSNFCPHCGATLVKPEAAAQQVAPDRQTYTPADGAYAGQTEEDRKQAFDCGSTQTETPTYYYTPCGENMYYAEKAEKKSPGKVPSILSLVFGGVSISFMIEAVGASFAYDPYHIYDFCASVDFPRHSRSCKKHKGKSGSRYSYGCRRSGTYRIGVFAARIHLMFIRFA